MLLNPFLIGGFKIVDCVSNETNTKMLLYKLEHGYSKLRSITGKD